MVKFTEYFLSRKSRKDWSSWWTLFMTLPFVFGLAVLVSDARRESEIGNRQRTTTGNITAHEPANHDTCRYTYSLHGMKFNGADFCPYLSANYPVVIGAEVAVFFDPANPAASALEDFNGKSRRDKEMIRILAFGIVAVAAVILFSKANERFKSARSVIFNVRQR